MLRGGCIYDVMGGWVGRCSVAVSRSMRMRRMRLAGGWFENEEVGLGKRGVGSAGWVTVRVVGYIGVRVGRWRGMGGDGGG